MKEEVLGSISSGSGLEFPAQISNPFANKQSALWFNFLVTWRPWGCLHVKCREASLTSRQTSQQPQKIILSLSNVCHEVNKKCSQTQLHLEWDQPFWKSLHILHCNVMCLFFKKKSSNRKIVFATFEISIAGYFSWLTMAMTPRLQGWYCKTLAHGMIYLIQHHRAARENILRIRNVFIFWRVCTCSQREISSSITLHAQLFLILITFFRRGSFLLIFKITFTDLTKLCV